MPSSAAPLLFSPPFCAPEAAAAQLRERGFALLSGSDVSRWSGASADALERLASTWSRLEPDAYLLDGGRYRRRRHSSFEFSGGSVAITPHRAHWQPVKYNALHGGIERWFEPMEPQAVASPALHQLLLAMGRLCGEVFDSGPDAQRWFVESHQFRIDTASGIGRPTPEGAHRDGVDLVAVFLVGRNGIKGGETRIFQAASPAGQRFTLTEPWSVLLLDDARMVHETTPVQPERGDDDDEVAQADAAAAGYRDTLVLTWRRHGFQGPGA